MELKKHYNKLWNQSIQKFKAGQFKFDSLIDSDNDTRYGITLLARPSANVKQRVSETLQKIEAAAPHQYYYPKPDLHITILSIISCYQGFSLQQINTDDYKPIINSAIQTISPFKIIFKGLTASASCILIQGFPEDNQLNNLRTKLRNGFKRTNLQHSIDTRYQLRTAHLTAIRLKQPLTEPEAFIKRITDLRKTDFGSCLINKLEFVKNDWYQQKDKVKKIHKFSLT